MAKRVRPPLRRRVTLKPGRNLVRLPFERGGRPLLAEVVVENPGEREVTVELELGLEGFEPVYPQ